MQTLVWSIYLNMTNIFYIMTELLILELVLRHGRIFGRAYYNVYKSSKKAAALCDKVSAEIGPGAFECHLCGGYMGCIRCKICGEIGHKQTQYHIMDMMKGLTFRKLDDNEKMITLACYLDSIVYDDIYIPNDCDIIGFSYINGYQTIKTKFIYPYTNIDIPDNICSLYYFWIVDDKLVGYRHGMNDEFNRNTLLEIIYF